MPATARLPFTTALSMLALAACQHVPTTGATMSASLPDCPAGSVSSQATLNATNGPLDYKACAGTLGITDGQGSKTADLFYTAYLSADSSKAPRPIAFIWNGGPGADSRLLHFHALGPKVLKNGALTDNPTGPLAAADLVFLDPAGTAFSRAATEAAAKRLYSTMGDIDATARFVRAFLQSERRENSPVYLIGESFGTWRAAGTAEVLIDQGQKVAGIGLISGGIPMGEERDRALMRALTLPNRTATALALGKLSPDLQAAPDATLAAAEAWARKVWYPALAKPEALNATDKAAVVDGLVRYMGLAPGQIDHKTLWVSPRDFRTKLLASEGKQLGIFDMRSTGSASDDKATDSAILEYYRNTLGYREGSYAGIETPELKVGENWQYDQSPITKESLARAMAGEGPPSPSQPWVLRDLRKAPHLRVFVATGLYDSLNGCAANAEAARDFPPELAGRIEARCYRGGHMMYEDAAEELQFAADVSAFLGNSPISGN